MPLRCAPVSRIPSALSVLQDKPLKPRPLFPKASYPLRDHTAKKSGRTAIALLLAAVVYASPLPAAEPIVLSPVEGTSWVRKCMEQYPELEWLADADVRKTQEGVDTLEGTYSEQLFGAKYIEFDRSVMALHCMRLFVDGSKKAYETFTAAQKDSKLTWESFQDVHKRTNRLLQSKWGGMSGTELMQAMETGLILRDLGKSPKMREIFKPFAALPPDHDDCYGKMIEVLLDHPKLCPSFARLNPSGKALLAKTANLAHYGHITHLEGGAGMFSQLKKHRIVIDDPIAIEIDLQIHLWNVAGALGHVNNRSSIVYTELTHRALQEMAKAVHILADPDKTEWDAYSAYLQARAKWLNMNPQENSECVLARVGAMLRLFTPQEGAVLQKAMAQFDDRMKERIIVQLHAAQESTKGRTPTYMPAVLVNLSNNRELGPTREERLHKAVTLGLLFITRVLEQHQAMLSKGEIDPDIPLNFNDAAGFAKTDPYLLINTFEIDRDGTVYINDTF
jgi:hypothetical protein